VETLRASSNPDTWNAIGVVRASAGNLDGGIEAFQHAGALDPRNAIARQNIGLTRLRQGDPSGALSAFEAASALDERLPRTWNGRGVALNELGRPEDAIRAWQRALELDPNQLDALFNLGVVALQRGHSELGRGALTRFVKVAPPARFPGDLARARALLASGQP
jgi:tetratricopeptide (TPR) repeat protein